MLTQGQVEDAIAKRVMQFYARTLGVGPREAKAYIVDDMVLVRLKGKLLPIEQHLLQKKSGVELVKNIREMLHETLTKPMNSLIQELTGHKVVSSHSDISTKTGERIEVFVLDTNMETEFRERLGM